jgi:hypothetical protein
VLKYKTLLYEIQMARARNFSKTGFISYLGELTGGVRAIII